MHHTASSTCVSISTLVQGNRMQKMPYVTQRVGAKVVHTRCIGTSFKVMRDSDHCGGGCEKESDGSDEVDHFGNSTALGTVNR